MKEKLKETMYWYKYSKKHSQAKPKNARVESDCYDREKVTEKRPQNGKPSLGGRGKRRAKKSKEKTHSS